MKLFDNAIINCLFKGASSGKDEHIEANRVASLLISLLCIGASGGFALHAVKNQQIEGLQFIPYLGATPMLFRFHEVWASPDRDSACGGFKGWYWKGYYNSYRVVRSKRGKVDRKKIVRHRGILSHTLTLGSPIRFGIAYCFPILFLVLGANWDLFYGVTVDDPYDVFAIVREMTMPLWLSFGLLWWFIVCLASDFVHFMMDRMNPIQFLITGDA